MCRMDLFGTRRRVRGQRLGGQNGRGPSPCGQDGLHAADCRGVVSLPLPPSSLSLPPSLKTHTSDHKLKRERE